VAFQAVQQPPQPQDPLGPGGIGQSGQSWAARPSTAASSAVIPSGTPSEYMFDSMAAT
jgi:hypothetical protein